MNSDAMQVVPNEQQQRTSTQQIANNSQSGNVIASLQPPVPQQGGPFPFFDAPEAAQPASAHGSGSRKGHEDQLRVAFGPRAFHWAQSDSRVLLPIIRTRRPGDPGVRRLHTEQDGEFKSISLEEFWQWKGIIHTFTYRAQHQSNGLVERKIGQLESTRAALLTIDLPANLWPDVYMAMCYTQNIVPSSALQCAAVCGRDSGCDTIKADLLEVLPIAIPERTRFVHTVKRGNLQLLHFAVEMLPARDALKPFLQSMAELLNASNSSYEARTIRIPPDFDSALRRVPLALRVGTARSLT